MRLDTLNANLFPQFSPDYRRYSAHMLAALAALRLADGYRLQLRCVPPYGNIDIAKSATFEGRATVPAGSYLWGISGSSSQAAGFDLQIRDTGNQAELFGRKCFYANATGQAVNGEPLPYPICHLPKPMPIVEPGEVLAQIWNRATDINTIQVVLWFASPEA